ncbi:MAG: HAD family hydrolase [Candidatus Methylomirabilales bacterium]
MARRPHLLIDFDHTLFDTDRFFWVDLRGAVLEAGIDPVAWGRAYDDVWPTGYSLAKHLRRLNQLSVGVEGTRVLRRLVRERFQDLRAYVFPDVVPTLRAWRRAGVTLVLLSFGHPTWQDFKVRGAGLPAYFAQILYAQRAGGKGSLCRRLARDDPRLAVVDNNPRDLDAMRALVPGLRTFLMQRVPWEALEASEGPNGWHFHEARRYVGLPARFPHRLVSRLSEVTP